MTSRNRRSITASVSNGSRGTTKISAYDGLLPEEALLLLVRQTITMHINEYSDSTKTAKWTGPSEKIQEIMTRGSVAAPVER